MFRLKTGILAVEAPDTCYTIRPVNKLWQNLALPNQEAWLSLTSSDEPHFEVVHEYLIVPVPDSEGNLTVKVKKEHGN